MDDYDLIMSRLSNFTTEINNTYVRHPMDNNLKNSSPINDINSKLKAFRNLISIAHLNSVSIPLHRDEIFRVIVETFFDIIGFSETNIKKTLHRTFLNFLVINFFTIIEKAEIVAASGFCYVMN